MDLTDDQWKVLEPFFGEMPGEPTGAGDRGAAAGRSSMGSCGFCGRSPVG